MLSLYLSSPSPPFLFADHLDPKLVHYLPTAATLAPNLAGLPDFFLLRYAGDFATAEGGMLRLKLQFKPPSETVLQATSAAGQQLRAVVFDRGFFRVRVRSHLAAAPDQVGDWHPLDLSGPTLASTMMMLSADEVEMLKQLLEDGRDSVEIELDLRYRGLVKPLPWIVTATVAKLKQHLSAQLGQGAVRADQVVAAFLSLPQADSPLRWRSLYSDEPEPLRDELLTEVAWRSLDALFQPETNPASPDPPLYRLSPPTAEDADTLSWDLLVPRLAEVKHPVTWQSSELAPFLTDPAHREALFPVVEQPGLFGTTTLHVINSLTCDPHYLKEIRVALRYPGPSGVPEYHSVVFNPESPTLEKLQVAYPTFKSFDLEYQITAVLAAPDGKGWPVMWKRDFTRAEGTVVEVNRSTADLEIVKVSADPAVFERAGQLLIGLQPRTTAEGANATSEPTMVTLNRDRPTTHVAFPGIGLDTPVQMRCIAYPPEGSEKSRYDVMHHDVVNRAVHVAAYQLEALGPDYVSVQSLMRAEQFAYVAVAIAPADAPTDAEGTLYSLPLDSHEMRRCPIFRSSVFDPPWYRYQIHYVAYDDAGETLPIATTNWQTEIAAALVIAPDLIA